MTPKDCKRILAGLCERQQSALRRQIALDQPSFSEEEVTDAQAEIVGWLAGRFFPFCGFDGSTRQRVYEGEEGDRERQEDWQV